MLLVPKRVFFTKGVGVHKEELRSFELALRDAGIEKCNLVTVSSICPPHCKIIQKAKGLKELHPGAITFTVMSRNKTNESNRLISAAVGLAMPKDKGMYGYLSETHLFGRTDEEAGDYAEDLAASMLASTLGIECDQDIGWNKKEEAYKISNKIVRTSNIVQSAKGKDKLWTTVVAAAIFLFS